MIFDQAGNVTLAKRDTRGLLGNSATLQAFDAIRDGTRTAFSTITAPITRADLSNNTSSLLTGIGSTSTTRG